MRPVHIWSFVIVMMAVTALADTPRLTTTDSMVTEVRFHNYGPGETLSRPYPAERFTVTAPAGEIVTTFFLDAATDTSAVLAFVAKCPPARWQNGSCQKEVGRRFTAASAKFRQMVVGDSKSAIVFVDSLNHAQTRFVLVVGQDGRVLATRPTRWGG